MGAVFPFLGLGVFASLLFVQPSCSAAAIQEGLQLCARSILPTIFPFFVLTNLWIRLGCARTCSRWLGPWVAKLFHLPPAAASPLLLGAVGGYPVGALTTAALCKEGRLSGQEAAQCLFFCNNAGPAFLVGVVGCTMLHRPALGLLLWAVHLGAALLLGLLFRPAALPAVSCVQDTPNAVPSFWAALTGSVRQAGETVVQLCAFLLFFSVLTGQLRQLLPADALWAEVLLASLELAGGLHRLSALVPSASVFLPLCTGLLAWGGLCVHCQSISAICDAELPVGPYLTGKALHCLLATALLFCPALLLLLPLGWRLSILLKTATGKRGRLQV